MAAQLTSHGYSQAGGTGRVFQTSADAVYDALPAGQQPFAREILTRLTAASSDGPVTRRAFSRANLYVGHPGTAREQIDAILEAFTARRLLVLGDGTAEISHDALLHIWPRFRIWLEEDQASLIRHSQLTEDAAAWGDRSKDSSFLYRGTQLAAVRQATVRWSAGRYPQSPVPSMTSCWNRRRRGWDCAPADRARCLRPARGKKRDIRCHRSRHLSTAGGSYRRPFPHPPGVECRCSNRAIPAGMPIRHLTGFQVGDSRHQDDRRTGPDPRSGSMARPPRWRTALSPHPRLPPDPRLRPTRAGWRAFFTKS